MVHCQSPQPGALLSHLVRLDSTSRRCSTRLRHKTSRDCCKPLKENRLTLHKKFARISQLATPTAARWVPAAPPGSLTSTRGKGTPGNCKPYARVAFRRGAKPDKLIPARGVLQVPAPVHIILVEV